MFRALLCSSSGGQNCPVHRTATYRVWWYQMPYNTILTSWWWAQQCSKHVEEYNKLIIKRRICVWSWLITKIILRCTVSKTSKKKLSSLGLCLWYQHSVHCNTMRELCWFSLWNCWLWICEIALNYAGFMSQARDDLETRSSCIIRGLEFVSCPKVLKYEAERLPASAEEN